MKRTFATADTAMGPSDTAAPKVPRTDNGPLPPRATPIVYVAGMNLRGAWAARPSGSVTLNVTSAQQTAHPDRKTFSPMTPVSGGYHGYHCFENWWQAGKVFDGIPHTTSQVWWKAQTKGKRRYPRGKGKRVLHARFGDAPYPPPLGYVESRKRVYVPRYFEYIERQQRFQDWKARVERGEVVVVYDFDGPRTVDGAPTCLEVTVPMLQQRIAQTRFPFGHGYVVAAALAGIHPVAYTDGFRTEVPVVGLVPVGDTPACESV